MSASKSSNPRQAPELHPCYRQDSSVKVFVRFRPLSDSEKVKNNQASGQTSLFHPISSKIVGFGTEEDLQSYTFDEVFSGTSVQTDVFESVAKPILNDIIAGYNGTVFAYGQTGSGKTFTMMGELNDERKQGIVPRLAGELFRNIEQDFEEDDEFIIKVSIMEIYKDKLIDLLNSSAGELKIKQNVTRGVFVSGLTVVCPTSFKELMEVVVLGQELRTVAMTNMNSSSSRSHLIITAEVIQHFSAGIEKRGILNLVDLAGSEKVRNSGVTGNNLDEAKKINLSLSALGNVISSLVSGKDHIPYRDSKLTRILQDSLGGNFKTSLIVNCSQASNSKEETLNSLSFALRAKSVKNRAKINIKESPENYLKTIESLKAELSQARVELQTLKDKTILTETRTVSQSYISRKPTKTHSNASKRNKARVESPVALGSTRNTPISLEFSINDKKNFCFEQDFINSSFFTPDKANEDFDHLKETQEDLENKKKAFELEEKNEELLNENKNLMKKLKNSQEKVLELEKKSLEYYTLYHKTLALIHRDSAENVVVMKKNENLNKSVKALVQALQEQERKLSYLAEIQRSRDVTQVEFLDTVLNTSKSKIDFEDLIDSSSDLDFSLQEFSICPEKLSFCSPYGQKLEDALGSNKTLSKDLIIYQLKSQLIEASIFNSNLAWKLESLHWKLNLIRSKLQIKITQHKQSKSFMQNCEKIIEDLYKFVSKPGKLVESSSPTEKKARMLRSFYAKSFKSDQIEKSFQSLSFLGPSFDVDCESLTNKFKSLETRLEVTESYNRQLKQEIEIERNKKQEIKAKNQPKLQEMIHRFDEEKAHWARFFVESKKNCQVELARKQEELNKLNEILAEWINRFMEVQNGLVTKEMHRKIQLLMINTVSFYSASNPIHEIFKNSPLN